MSNFKLKTKCYFALSLLLIFTAVLSDRLLEKVHKMSISPWVGKK